MKHTKKMSRKIVQAVKNYRVISNHSNYHGLECYSGPLDIAHTVADAFSLIERHLLHVNYVFLSPTDLKRFPASCGPWENGAMRVYQVLWGATLFSDATLSPGTVYVSSAQAPVGVVPSPTPCFSRLSA